MNYKERISGYKSMFTPMEDESKILEYYMRNFKETGEVGYQPVIRSVLHFHKIPRTTFVESQYENKNREFIKLYTEFIAKWNADETHFAGFSKAMVFEKIKEVFDRLLGLSPNYITFELTEDCSVFFQSSVYNKNIYLELFFLDDVEDSVEAITNIYQDGKCTYAFGGTIENTFLQIEKKILKYIWKIEPTPSSYDLSESAFTEILF